MRFPLPRISLALAAAALVAGCSSGIPLDNPGNAGAGAALTSQGSASGVQGVHLGGTQLAEDGGPRAVSRIIFFDFDSFIIRADTQGIIDAHARLLRSDPTRHIVIEGHTDERGGREYNLALGQKRAEAVRRSLSLLGVPEAQMESVSFGKEKPAAQGSSEAAHSQNRRAEISYR